MGLKDRTPRLPIRVSGSGILVERIHSIFARGGSAFDLDHDRFLGPLEGGAGMVRLRSRECFQVILESAPVVVVRGGGGSGVVGAVNGVA